MSFFSKNVDVSSYILSFLNLKYIIIMGQLSKYLNRIYKSNKFWRILNFNSLNDYKIYYNIYKFIINKPTGVIFNTHNLKDINLGQKQITNLPKFINLYSIRSLNLSRNKLLDIPNLDYLYTLQELYLADNYITSFNMGFVNLPNLKILSLSRNFISEIPEFINLPNLQKLYLYANQITNVPNIMGLPNLKFLYLAENLIFDVYDFDYLPKLKLLDISNNPINSLNMSNYKNIPPHIIKHI